MRRWGFLCLAAWAAAMIVSVARADDVQSRGPIYNVVHFDVIPLTLDGVDFHQTGYSLLFKYRNQSQTDAGLQSFRVLNLLAPETNHSEIVQVWRNYQDYKNHLAQPDTVAFRFGVQGNPALAGGSCCIGSPIDDRQYSLLRAFNMPWPSSGISSTVGTSGALYVITYVELLQEGNVREGQNELLQYGANPVLRALNAQPQPTTVGPREEVYCNKVGALCGQTKCTLSAHT
jgi:hypothetical protein